MNDLEIAKAQLHKEQAAMAIVKDGNIVFITRSHRISGFLEAIDQLGAKLENSSVADRIVGKAVALLCVYVKARNVYADVLSKKAKIVLNESEIVHDFKDLVENILNSDKSKLCPFEEIAEGISNPTEAYHSFKKLHKTLCCGD